jgi:hypothetical protein
VKQEFINLILNGVSLDSMYNQALQNSGISILQQFANVRQSNFCSQWHFWQNNSQTLKKYEKYLVNPYYIGAGNPDSDIIFIGKELAHNPSNNPDLFFLESISNWYLWNEFIKNINFNSVSLSNNSPPNIDSLIQNFTTKYQYCPLNPLSSKHINSIGSVFNGGHTWRKEEKIILNSKYSSGVSSYNKKNYQFSTNFFSKCFTTELNCVPSKNKGIFIPNNNPRVGFIFNGPMKSFINSFKNIIFGCKTYLSKINNYQSLISSCFNVQLSKNHNLYSCKNVSDVFLSNNKLVIVCSQISGAAGWSDSDLSLLGQSLL